MTALLAVSCDSSTAPSSALNLTGTWSGMVGQPQSGSALRLTWTAAQSGPSVSGQATLIKPAANVPATGTMSGTLSGAQLTMTYNLPAGSVLAYSSCTITGSGQATATNTLVTGNLELTFTNCLGSGLDPTGSSQFSLTKQ